MAEAVGNIRLIEQAYEAVKEHIAYEAFNGFVIFIAVFLLLSRSFDEYNKYIERSDEPPTILGIWGHLKGYVFLIVLIPAMPVLFNVVEVTLAELSSKLIEGFGGDSDAKATDTMNSLISGYNDEYAKKVADASGLDYLALIWDGVANLLSNGCSLILAPIGIFVFKYTYTFFIICRYMWLLMLEVVAPIAIICLIHNDTKQYFMAWIKNMFLCYLLIPLFLLADLFSNAVALAMMGNSDGSTDPSTGWITVLLVVIVKLRVFSVVSSRIHQLI